MRTNICLAIMALFAWMPVTGIFAQYSLTVEASPAVNVEGTVYRFYVNANDPTDKISAVFGNDQANLVINAPDGIFNSEFNASWNASGINAAFLVAFPELAEDSYATIGLEGPASASGLDGAADPSIVEDSDLSPTISEFFTVGGTSLNVSTLVGGSWYVLNTAANALPVDGRWLVAQITSPGALSGQINYQIFPLGVGQDQIQVSESFDTAAVADVEGCTDSAACNYDASATVDDGSCAELDACGVCGGSGVDADADGICDDVDDCVGPIDGCGVCNGDGTTCTGCADPAASNYDENNIFADNGQCVYATTFNVDMNCFDNAGASLNGFDSFYEVFVTGPVFGWAANDGYNQLTDEDGDGIYTVTLDFPAGDVEYKYAIDGFADQEQLVDDMQNEGDCAPITDYAGYANRQVAAGSTTNDTYGSCTSCEDQAVVEMYDLTLQVDMTQYAEAYAYGGVFVNGGFNGWCGGCNPMSDDDGDGIWTVTLNLAAGTYEYKFTLDGWNYQEEFAGGESCTSTIDGFTNRSVLLEANTTMPAVCWESCDVCPDIDDVLGCMDESANNYNAEATVEPENSCLYDLTVSVDISQTSFTGVTLAGGFNGWNNGSNPMSDDDGDGIYSITVSVTAGAQEYKFLGNGDWGLAESFDGTESCTTDPGEYVNRVILVEGPTTVDAVCYNSCEACPDEVEGCIDETACNYEPEANVQAFVSVGSGQLSIELTAGSWPSEISWTLNGATYGAPYSGIIDLEPGMYLIEGFDSYGDGWNGASMSITDLGSGSTYALEVSGSSASVEVEVTGAMASTCDFESCAGCTDETACNYDETATLDDGTCEAADDLTGCGDTCLDGGVLYEFSITDSYGDGMCCTYGEGSYTILINGEEVATGGDFGDGAMERFCAPADACVQLVMVADNYPGEQSWSLTADGTELASGNGASETYNFGTCVEGCTDGAACNYDMDANADDGSCFFAPEYYACDGETCLNDSDGDGVCDELEIEGCVVPTACNYNMDATDLVPCIYPDAGYNCDGTCIGDADGDGVCDANEIEGCQDSSACNYNADATDAGDCDFTSCLGCTDDAACNYDASATQNDGSCDYCSCASDADGGQNGFNLSVETYAENGVQGTTTYRVYVTTPNATDFVSAIAGDEINPSYLRTSTSFFQSDLGGLTADMINPLFFSAFPELAYDSWLTIGIESAPVPGDGTAAVTLAQAAGDTWAADFEAGQNLELNSFFGGSWFTTNLSTNGVAGDDQRVLVAQLTTDGTLTGQLYVQVFPEGVGANAEYLTLSFGSSTCGCTDENACNYNASAIYDDGSCVIAGIYTCEGVCANDADGDGVCDELEIVGCSDEEACNYNADATDEGACEYVEPTLLPGDAPACGLFFSGYAEGSSNNKFLEIYNPTANEISLDGYAFPNVSNAPNVPGEYEYWNTFEAGASVAPGDVYVIAHGSADPAILAEADQTFSFLSNGDDGFMLVMGTQDDFIQIDAIGDWNGDPGSGWDVAGVSAGTKDHSLIRKSDITNGNGGDWIGSAGTDADNSEWIVLEQNDWTGLGSHEFTGSCEGGNYAVVYDCDGVCLNDADGDGVCDELEIDGCTDSIACNYDSAATDEDGSCEYLTCAGCTDDTACNYDETATIEDGSCAYPEPFLDCAGNCLNDLNINGICDELEVLGCTYTAACNYDMDANVDDGQCDFSCLLTGCTDPAADNYDAAATVDDGNCFYVGCVDENALNYDSGANFPGACDYCEGDFNYDGEVDVNDLLDFFQLWGNVCE